MVRRSYKNPPIMEAVIDLRFASEVSGASLLNVLAEKVGDKYSGTRRNQDKVELEARVAAESASASVRRLPHLTFLTSHDGLRLLGCGASTLSVHALAPYPGWEALVDQATHAVGALPAEVTSRGLSTIAVRYIDRILLPSVDVPLEDYFTVLPARPQKLPSRLSAFFVTTRSVDEQDDTAATLTVASGPADPSGQPVVIYDLTVSRQGSPLCSLEGTEWMQLVEAFHERQRDIFEQSITAKTRELFR
ncbi:MAG: TIGR04255 family protein [Deltaproteobacteria bacterium]|nr:TIGR04255 family protein [Deltaproteobacteria bacterium]